MRLSRHAPMALLVTTAAAAALTLQPIPLCQAERFRFFSSRKEPAAAAAADHRDEGKAKAQPGGVADDRGCPFYGCPLKPIDVHYNTAAVKEALSAMRGDKRVVVSASAAATRLRESATHQHATLTLIGYKGGELQAQVNQDRALIVAPYRLAPDGAPPSPSRAADGESNSDERAEAPVNAAMASFLNTDRILLGVFDGHAPFGERVSEYTVTELPKLLAANLSTKAKSAVTATNKPLSERDEMDLTRAALIETFVELDRTAPADPSGGCTATVVLQQGAKVYIANAGDSRSFVVAYRPSTRTVTVAYLSREDKPSLPDERARVEAAGGQVYIPARGTSRVVYHDSTTGAPTGLAMSRSIGDWEAGKMGVIPDPIVDVVDVHTIVASILLDDVGDENNPEAYMVDPVGVVTDAADYSQAARRNHAVGGTDDDVCLFAVCATDGLLDYVGAAEIARILAHALYDESGAHPVTAVEHLIFAAANAWQDAKQGRYRDDIAIAVAALRRPPPHRPAAAAAQ